MGQPVGRLEEGRAASAGRVGDAVAVVPPAKADLLFPPQGDWLRRRWRRLGPAALFRPCHRGTEAKARAAYRPHDALRTTVVLQRLAQALDAAVQRGGAHEAVSPHLVEQLLLTHEPIAVLDQVAEHGVHLRLQVKRVVTPPKLAPTRVEHEFVEEVNHRTDLVATLAKSASPGVWHYVAAPSTRNLPPTCTTPSSTAVPPFA